jgi:hypothetical protein
LAKRNKKLKKAAEIQEASETEARVTSAAELDNMLTSLMPLEIKVATQEGFGLAKTGKRTTFVKNQLKFYRSPVFSKRLVKYNGDIMYLREVKKQNGTAFTALQHASRHYELPELLANLKIILMLVAGTKALTVEEANVAGTIPRDTRIMRQCDPVDAARRAGEAEALKKKTVSLAKYAKSADTIMKSESTYHK